MGLFTSMSSAVSGIGTASTELSVISDNIANASTTGFKAERAAFEDALYQSLVGGGGQVGLGSRLSAVQKMLTQGSLSMTGLSTDLAIQGRGYLVVHGQHGGEIGEFYTRAGETRFDKDGYLVNLEGLRVQGYPADPTGVLSTITGDLLIGNAQALPLPTSSLTFRGNLNAEATLLPAWDPANPSTTSNFSTSVTTYDSLGAPHPIQLYFRITGAGAWDWHAMTDGGGLTGGTAGTLTQVAGGTLTFDNTGALTTVTQASAFSPLGAVNPQPLTFDFGDPSGAGGTGVAGMTQFASSSAATFVSQNGYPAGDFSALQMEQDGIITGVFSNGQHRVLGQIVVADFAAADQLLRIGGNLLSATSTAGEPVVGAPGVGGRGSIVSGALEASNVDIAEQFVRMIAAQRSFEANAKSITTADQLLSELIAIKR
jgi:flagellar hook protein FlgE